MRYSSMGPPSSGKNTHSNSLLKEVGEGYRRPDPGRIRLLVAVGHTIMREGLCQLFCRSDDIDVVEEATDGGEVIARIRSTEADVLLLDMDLPGSSGESLIGHLLTKHPKLRILAFSSRDDPLVAQHAIRGGAAGFLTKDCNHTTLLFAVRRLAAGGRFIEPHLAEYLAFKKPSDAESARHEKLSCREFQILRQLAVGRSINDIAVQLGINNRTVSTHKARLMQKMGFATNADLVRYAVEHRLTD